MADKDYAKMYSDFEEMNEGEPVIYDGDVWIKPIQSERYHLKGMFVNTWTGNIAHYSVVMDHMY